MSKILGQDVFLMYVPSDSSKPVRVKNVTELNINTNADAMMFDILYNDDIKNYQPFLESYGNHTPIILQVIDNNDIVIHSEFNILNLRTFRHMDGLYYITFIVRKYIKNDFIYYH